ncbi:hypothetical protein Leryth_004894 [Lithospermum erythrorhizon]|nr:hypothetical protein Leryth_004894 [Lithospermum erythrorhizon]
MAIKVYGIPMSTATSRPFGQVPALEDGDLKLFESRAITMYISYNYADKGTQLVSHDAKVMAATAVWMEVEAHKFDDVASKLCSELVIKPMFGRPIDEVAVVEHEHGLAKVLDIYEARLNESKYLAGESFTLADLHHLPVIDYLMATKAKALFDSRPHVSAWCDDILARPAWSKVAGMRKH